MNSIIIRALRIFLLGLIVFYNIVQAASIDMLDRTLLHPVQSDEVDIDVAMDKDGYAAGVTPENSIAADNRKNIPKKMNVDFGRDGTEYTYPIGDSSLLSYTIHENNQLPLTFLTLLEDAPELPAEWYARAILQDPLQGRIVLDDKSIDLATGKVRRAIVPEFRDKETPLVTEASDGSGFVQLVQRCEHVSNSFKTRDCVIFWDAQGSEVFRFKLNWRFQTRPPRLSPDGQLIALIDLDKQELVIIDRTGHIIDHSRQHVADVAWASDGSLVYSSRQSIYKVAASQINNKSADTLIQRFKSNRGYPGRLSVSPDGARIAFSLVTNSNLHSTTSTVWTINLNGSNLQLFARSKSGFSDGVNKPLWSPDGQWILVRQKPYEAPGGAGPRRKGTLTALKSDIFNHELGLESEHQIDLRVVCFRKPNCNNSKEYTLPPHEVASWIASPGG